MRYSTELSYLATTYAKGDTEALYNYARHLLRVKFDTLTSLQIIMDNQLTDQQTRRLVERTIEDIKSWDELHPEGVLPKEL